MVKNPPAMQEMWVQCLGQKDSLEKVVATHVSILAWSILSLIMVLWLQRRLSLFLGHAELFWLGV